jgi:anthranilate 1,2-dioxygenase small subunit
VSGVPTSIREAARDLLDTYADLIDSDRLEDWTELFTNDATYQVLPRNNFVQNLPASLILCTNKKMLRDRIVSLRNANEYNPHQDRHIISGLQIAAHDGPAWQLRANYALYQTDVEGRALLFSVGQYRDIVRLEGNRLLFSTKLAIVDNFAVPTLLATPI